MNEIENSKIPQKPKLKNRTKLISQSDQPKNTIENKLIVEIKNTDEINSQINNDDEMDEYDEKDGFVKISDYNERGVKKNLKKIRKYDIQPDNELIKEEFEEDEVDKPRYKNVKKNIKHFDDLLDEIMNNLMNQKILRKY